MSTPRRASSLTVTVALLVGLAGCSGSDGPSKATTTTTRPAGKVEVNLDDKDNPTVEYTDKDGTTQFGSALPENWPAALDPPSSVTVVSSSTTKVDGKTELFVTGETTEAFDDVYAAVKAQLTGAGFKVTSDLRSDDGTFAGVSGTKGGTAANVTVSADAATGKVTVLYTVKPGT